jgi:CRP-like cAMP-binding protein
MEQFIDSIPRLKANWDKYRHLFQMKHIPARTVLLREGDIPRKMFFVRQGCLRASLNKKGKDVTFQFFFENDMVASIESFRTNQPSPISIISVEASTVIILSKSGFEVLLKDFPEIKDIMFEIVFRRFADYSRQFISYIINTPVERYLSLLKQNPKIIERIPQRYVASYLGITPVSLSRIRKRIVPKILNNC